MKKSKEQMNNIERDLDRLACPIPNTRRLGLTTAFITRLLSEINFNMYNIKSIMIIQHYNSGYSFFFLKQLFDEAIIFGYKTDEIKIINKNTIKINNVKITVEYCHIPFYQLIKNIYFNCSQIRSYWIILDTDLFDMVGNIPDTYLLFDYNLRNISKELTNKKILDFIQKFDFEKS